MGESAQRYDLFVSYAQADSAWVEGYLLDALNAAGTRCHSEQAFALGVPRLVEFERAIRQSQRTLLVLSPAYLADSFGPFTDLLAQTYGLETATWPVIPLILHPVSLPARLKMLVALDATTPDDWPRIVERLCAELERPMAEAQPRPACPYPGILPFGEPEQDRFFGRDAEIAEMIERLRLYPFLAIIGPSGCGKSSLVFAGLIPAVRQSSLLGRGEWRVLDLRPGGAPLRALAQAMGTGTSWLERAQALLAPHTTAQRLLLVVDQFEEVFVLAGTEEREPFQQALLGLIESGICYIVLTIRADFYPDLMLSPLWAEIRAHRVEVQPLSGNRLRQAIVRPAENVGVFAESALIERLIADAGQEPGALPLVQETLVLLWERLERRLLPLRAYDLLALSRRAYDLAGPPASGLQVALSRRADAVLAGLPAVQQAIARRVLVRLVQFGEGRADTRRQQTVDNLFAAGDNPADLDHVLEHLARGRLLTLSGEEPGERRVDLAHEALIEGWPTLRCWLHERREIEQARRRLEDKAAEWVRLGQAQSGLLDQVELGEAQRWLERAQIVDVGYSELLTSFVRHSAQALTDEQARQEAARRRERMLERRARRRLQAIVLILSALVLAGAAWLGYLETLRQQARALGELLPVDENGLAFERYEVTNRRYALCVRSGRCTAPFPQFSTYFDPAAQNLPVSGVDAASAQVFCQWMGRRLPTVQEWQQAATQNGTQPWPWGSEPPDPDRANLEYDEPREPEPVGIYADGDSPEGIHDLIGNVWEWTSTAWEDSSDKIGAAWSGDVADLPARLIVAGGGYMTAPGDLLDEPKFTTADSGFRDPEIGFRCVKGGGE